MAKYIIDAFASSGDKTVIPDAVQPDGSVSWLQGFGPDYALKLGDYVNAKAILRDIVNEVFYELSLCIQQYQQHGVPDFITTLDNGGTPYSYDKWAYVLYDPGGGKLVYQSTANANTALPTDATKWTMIDDSGGATVVGVQDLQYTKANATGTANALVVALNPVATVNFGIANVLPSATNTGACTFNAGFGVVALSKLGPSGLTPLVGGELRAGGVLAQIFYNASGAVLLNPFPVAAEAVTVTQLRNQTYTAFVDTGTPNAVVLTPSPAYVLSGFATIGAFIQHANTGAATITINGTTVAQTKKSPVPGGAPIPLTGGELVPNSFAFYDWNGVSWELQNPANPTALPIQISLSGTQSIPASSSSTIFFNTVDYDPYGMSNPPGIRIPINGYYDFTAIICGTGSVSSSADLLFISVNGSRTAMLGLLQNNGTTFVINGSCKLKLNTGDIVTLEYKNNNSIGVPVILQTFTDIVSPNIFQMAYIGAA